MEPLAAVRHQLKRLREHLSKVESLTAEAKQKWHARLADAFRGDYDADKIKLAGKNYARYSGEQIQLREIIEAFERAEKIETLRTREALKHDLESQGMRRVTWGFLHAFEPHDGEEDRDREPTPEELAAVEPMSADKMADWILAFYPKDKS